MSETDRKRLDWHRKYLAMKDERNTLKGDLAAAQKEITRLKGLVERVFAFEQA